MTLASPFWELGRELREMRCLYDLPQTRFPVIARLGPAAGMVGEWTCPGFVPVRCSC